MLENKDSLQEIIKSLEEDDETTIVKKWNEELFSKFILLFPIIIFLVTFFVINKDKTIFDLLIFVLGCLGLITFGLFINFAISKK